MRMYHNAHVLRCLLHMPQLLPEFQAFAVVPTVPTSTSIWGVCSKHRDTEQA